MSKEKVNPLLGDAVDQGDPLNEPSQTAPAKKAAAKKVAAKKAPARRAAPVTKPAVPQEDENLDTAAEKVDPNAGAQAEPDLSKMSPDQKEEYMQKKFAEELKNGPQTGFIIPLSLGEKPGAYETVNLNGCRYTIRKGSMVTVPVAIAEVLAEKYQVEMSAGQDKLIDRDERTISVLG